MNCDIVILRAPTEVHGGAAGAGYRFLVWLRVEHGDDVAISRFNRDGLPGMVADRPDSFVHGLLCHEERDRGVRVALANRMSRVTVRRLADTEQMVMLQQRVCHVNIPLQ